MAAPADCPECAKPMVHQRIEPPGRTPVELDACDACGGLWFDRGELARASTFPPEQVVAGTRSALKCPRCAVALFDEILGAATPAQSCFRCKGVWAPGPSVDAIIRLHPKPTAPAPTAEEPKKRRLGDWLSAWLDG